MNILRRWAWGDGPDWVACEREIAENAEKARQNAREGDGWESEGGAEWRRRRVYKGEFSVLRDLVDEVNGVGSSRFVREISSMICGVLPAVRSPLAGYQRALYDVDG